MAIISLHLWRAQERGRKIMTGAARSDLPGRLVRLRHGYTYYEIDAAPRLPIIVCIHNERLRYRGLVNLADVNRLLLLAPAGIALRWPNFRRFARAHPRLSDAHILALLPMVTHMQFRTVAARFRHDQLVQEVAKRQLTEEKYRGYIPALLSSLKGILAHPMAQEHRRIAASDVAVRSIFARNDTTIPYTIALGRFLEWNSNAVHRTISGVGHSVTYTHAPQINDMLNDFL